jgi:hypothetical protein
MRGRVFWWAVFGTLSVAAVVPLFRAQHPPLQDLPQHLAAISVLRHYPELGLGELFEIHLFRTQYLAYYGLSWLLSYPFGVALGNKLLLTCALVALPFSLASLLSALGRDERLALFAFPLTYNAHLILGFFNFIAALPLMFYGLSLAVRLREHRTRAREVGFALVLLVCFYTHVVPFAFLGLGAVLIAIGDGLRATARRALPFVPAALSTLVWLSTTPAGGATLAAAGAAEAEKRPQFASVTQALRDAPNWLTDVLHGTRDETLLVAWFVLALLALALGSAGSERAPRELAGAFEQRPALAASFSMRLSLLCPLAVLAYFITPTGYDWIWPISARFPLIALLFAILLVPRQRGLGGAALLCAVAVTGFVSFAEVGRAFAAFEREEVGEIDAAIAAIPEGERVAGLIFDRGSRQVKFSPFLHYVALVQAEKGGAVMFTFADFPQSPFRFREEARPPPVPPRWEWTPERVDPARDLGFYRYVLVRGGPGQIAHQSASFETVFRGAHWTVFRRK